jgi:aminoglycoside phosphotransferase (APT) family kinase protein
LVHGDAHLENLPLLPDGSDVLFLDWADVCTAPPSHDLAFFVVMSLPIEKRRGVERELIARHADAVGAFGADPIAAYRWGVLIRAARIVAIALVRPVEDMLASAGLRLVAKRSLTAAADWF